MDTVQLQANGIKITSIDDNIHVIQGRGRSRSPFSNAFLVTDRTNVLIDTGCGLETIERLLALVPVDLVINSHAHPDHTAGNWLVSQTCQADICVPAEEHDSIAETHKLALRMAGADLAPLWCQSTLAVTGFRDFTISALYREGHEFHLGKTRFLALHTPGHLADHYCLWEPDRRILLGFDIDLSPFGGWYGNQESDLGAFRSSVERLQALPIEHYLSSHARPVRGAHVARRLQSYRAVFDRRRELIRDLLPAHEWASPAEITAFSPIYAVAEHEPLLLYNERQMVTKHLDELAARGEIERLNGGFRRIPA